MLRENVFTAVTLLMFAGFAYTVIRANYLIIVLRRQIVIPYHWSGRTSIAELKQAANMVKDDTQRKQIEKAIALLKASKAIAYGGFVVFVSLMIFWKR